MLAGKVIKGTGEKWIAVFQNMLYGDMAASEYCSGSCVFMLVLIGLYVLAQHQGAVFRCRRSYYLSIRVEFLKERRSMWKCPKGEKLFIR